MGRGANPQFAISITGANGFTYSMWDGAPYNFKAGATNPGGGLWVPPVAPVPINGPAAAPAGTVAPFASPPVGNLFGVDLNLNPAGGWTFATLRCRIVCPVLPFDPLIWGASSFNSGAIIDSWVLFDSGTLAAGAIVASATTPFIRENFSDRPQPFGSWLMFCIDWTTSAGGGTSNLLGTMHADLNEVRET